MIKYARQNKILLKLRLSIPLQLNDNNFYGMFANLDPSDYSFQLLPQDQSDLTEADIVVSYNRDI